MINTARISVGQGMPLLFTQLTWPSGLVRERACVQIARFLLDPEYAEETVHHLLQWMKSQRLESTNALGLLALYRVRLERSDFTLPPFEDVVSAVVRPSMLSALLLQEFAPDNFDALQNSLRHSGEAPRDFSPDTFFTKNVATFLPPYYDYLAGLIEKREMIAFRRHWAYEWKGLVEETSVKLTDRSLYFWYGSTSNKERVYSTDTKLSEVYRSAFLRALAWAVSTDRLEVEDALENVAEACPINLELWRVKPAPKPDWFPRAEEPPGNIDTVPAQVWRQVEEMWKRQLHNPSEWMVARASGIVLDSATVYDLEIYGMFQKSHGPGEPRLESVPEWCRDELQLSAQLTGHLHFSGTILQQKNRHWVKAFGDWSFAPAAASLNVSPMVSWQYWRTYRRVWLPTPFLGATRLSFSCGDESVSVYEGGEVIAYWFDWTDGLTERHHVELPMPAGQCLQIRRKTIEEFTESTGSSFCWVCRLTGYHRKDTYEPYKQVRDHREFGCTRIATD